MCFVACLFFDVIACLFVYLLVWLLLFGCFLFVCLFLCWLVGCLLLVWLLLLLLFVCRLLLAGMQRSRRPWSSQRAWTRRTRGQICSLNNSSNNDDDDNNNRRTITTMTRITTISSTTTTTAAKMLFVDIRCSCDVFVLVAGHVMCLLWVVVLVGIVFVVVAY